MMGCMALGTSRQPLSLAPADHMVTILANSRQCWSQYRRAIPDGILPSHPEQGVDHALKAKNFARESFEVDLVA
jgi:hypothetical protein